MDHAGDHASIARSLFISVCAVFDGQVAGVRENLQMKLSDCKMQGVVIRDVEFQRLGSTDATCAGLLVYVDSLTYLCSALENPSVRAVITTSELADQVPEKLGLVVAQAPRDVFYDIHQQFLDQSMYVFPFSPGVGTGCKIHASAFFSDGCSIGDNVRIGEHVTILAPVWIGSNVTIEAGAKLGMEGILYRKANGMPRLIPHGGYVRIHDNAVLMSNSVVVRSVHDTDVTEVGSFALIGLGSIVGHEAKIGARAVVSNQCVIARKSVIGAGAFLGTNATIKENIRIGDGAKVMAGSVVIEDVLPGAIVSGNFASDHRSRMIDFARAKNRPN